MRTLDDRYTLVEVLGTGAFATVWHAHDTMLGTDVAIKILADNWARDYEIRDRFLSEARHAMTVTSPHIVRVHHVAESSDDRMPYIVMSLANGGTLRDRITARKLDPHTESEACAHIANVAAALADLHQQGLIHRDVKPANILFHTDDRGTRTVLGDFGLARSIDRSALTLVSGTPAYSAPEQVAGLTQLDHRADLYPLGVMLLELVTGDLPTPVAGHAIDVDRHLETHNATLSSRRRALVDQLLDPNPERRPELAHIRAALGGQQPPPVPTVARVDAAPPVVSAGRGRWPVIGVVVALVVVAAAISGAVWRDGESDSVTATTTPIATTPSTTTTADAVTTTSAPSTEAPAAPASVNGLPEVLPVPAAAVEDARSGNRATSRRYNIAGTVEEIADEYRSLAGWSISDETAVGDTRTFIATNADNEPVNVLLETVPNSAGVNITRITITP